MKESNVVIRLVKSDSFFVMTNKSFNELYCLFATKCWMLDAMFVFDHLQSKQLSKVRQSHIKTLGSQASAVFRKHWYLLGGCLLFLCLQGLAGSFSFPLHLLSSFLVS